MSPQQLIIREGVCLSLGIEKNPSIGADCIVARVNLLPTGAEVTCTLNWGAHKYPCSFISTAEFLQGSFVDLLPVNLLRQGGEKITRNPLVAATRYAPILGPTP